MEHRLKQGKTNRVLPRKCTGHSKHPLPITQEKTTHGHHQVVNTKIRLIIFFAAKDGEDLYSQQKSPKCSSLLKNDRMISVHFQGKPFIITVIQVYTSTSNVEEAEVEQFYEDL